jgi:UDP-2,3-diacylglucosamine pyrophosphatase LpxH
MRRVVTISDLHIGGAEYPMLGHPEILIDFLEQLASYNGRDEVELVIAGDFIDFLAEAPHEAWTASENGAVDKINAILHRLPALFDAFARCARHVPRFTVLLGNHDIELAYPRVRDTLFRRLDVSPHRCLFVHTNEAYRIGDLLIEHGN